MTYDYVHPNKAGQLFMTERWYRAILQNLNDRNSPTLKSKQIAVSKSSSSATLSWAKAKDNYGIQCYILIVDGKVVAKTGPDNEHYTLHGLSWGRNYKIGIVAQDWSGNTSKEVFKMVQLKK